MIFVLMGKSAAGKDTILRNILANDKIQNLKEFKQVTTRPMRDGETEGVEYHFITNNEFNEINPADIAEMRTYEVYENGSKTLWRYLILKDEFKDNIDKIGIGTLDTFRQLKKVYGDAVVPIYIEVPNKIRVNRAMDRMKDENWSELFRRLLADELDFSYDKLREAGLNEDCCFDNTYLEMCIENIVKYIEYRRIVH